MSKRRLAKAIDKLAEAVPYGHLLASSDPAELLNAAASIIRDLNARHREAVKGGDWARAEATSAKGALVVAQSDIRDLQARGRALAVLVEELRPSGLVDVERIDRELERWAKKNGQINGRQS